MYTTGLLEVIEILYLPKLYRVHEWESNSRISVITDSDWIGTGITMVTLITSKQLCHNDLDNDN